MLRKKQNDVEWLEFELLAGIPGLVHGVFLKHGGTSRAPFTSLNVGGGTGDCPKCVELNREKIRSILDVKALISSHQCHGTAVELIDSHTEPGYCDGLITQMEGRGLMIKHADCQAAIFYDPIQRAIANVHAGWRGNVQNIYAITIEKMKREIGSKPQDLLVCISPSLGPDASEFKNFKVELPKSFWEFQIKPTYFDLWEISRQQLLECGILERHIEIAEVCTFTHAADFFSYRRDKTTGRNATLVALKPFKDKG